VQPGFLVALFLYVGVKGIGLWFYIISCLLCVCSKMYVEVSAVVPILMLLYCNVIYPGWM